MNWLIKLLSKLVRPIEGSPDKWLERDYPLGGIVWREFHCGSVRGIYRCENKEFLILAVQNTKKNNHFDKVLEWFEQSANRDGCAISFLGVGNPRLREKLLSLGWIGNEQKMTKIKIISHGIKLNNVIGRSETCIH